VHAWSDEGESLKAVTSVSLIQATWEHDAHGTASFLGGSQ
jgi:hypothetical protein